MAIYTVRVSTKGHETYEVEANSESEAREIWSDTEPFESVVEEAHVENVELEED